MPWQRQFERRQCIWHQTMYLKMQYPAHRRYFLCLSCSRSSSVLFVFWLAINKNKQKQCVQRIFNFALAPLPYICLRSICLHILSWYKMYYNNSCVFSGFVWNFVFSEYNSHLNSIEFTVQLMTSLKLAYGLLLSSFDKLNYRTVSQNKNASAIAIAIFHHHHHHFATTKNIFYTTYLTF